MAVSHMLPAIWVRGCSIHPLAHCLPMSPQMNDNQIDNWSDLDELKNAKFLETVYLERNPLQKDPQYRRKIMLALPTVRQIDATFIRFWAAMYNSPDSFSIHLKKKTYFILKCWPSCVITPYKNIPTWSAPVAHLTYMYARMHSLTPWSQAVAKKLHYLIDLIGAVNMIPHLIFSSPLFCIYFSGFCMWDAVWAWRVVSPRCRGHTLLTHGKRLRAALLLFCFKPFAQTIQWDKNEI